MALAYQDTIETHGVRVPFVPEIITPKLKRLMEAGRYETQECQRLFDLLVPTDRVLELGAGVGVVSTVAAGIVGAENVTCVEAHPGLIPILEETHALNNVSSIRRVHGVGGTAAGTATFYMHRDFWASTLTPRNTGNPLLDAVEVPVVDVGALIADIGVTALTMDIEGGELALLDALDLSPCRVAMIETHQKVYGVEGMGRLFRRMDDLGFGYDSMLSKGGSVVVFSRYRAA